MTPQTLENDFSGTTDQRVEKLIYYATRHGMALSHLTDAHDDLLLRLRRLEEERERRAIVEAREEERSKALMDKLVFMQKSIDDTRSNLNDKIDGLKRIGSKALGIALGAVLLTAVKWVLEGGLT